MADSLPSLIQQLKNGDSAAFDRIYEKTHRVVFYSILGILHDVAAAEDILQDTYMRFMDHLDQYIDTNLVSYLVTIAKRLAINEYHKTKRTVFANDSIDYLPSYDVSSLLETSQEKRFLIETALAALDSAEKEIVVLYNIAGLNHREIALVLDKPLGTITWLYARSLKKMRHALKEVEE
jgi:RNA polymerase sigma-70 factor, ECF subfamily